MSQSEAIDLFEHYEQMPAELAAICEPWVAKSCEGLDYIMCKQWLSEVEAIGYTFEFYLDAEPFGLVKMPEAFNQVEKKPCPFCGSANLLEGTWDLDSKGEVIAVECGDCYAGAPLSTWNNRSEGV